MTNLSLHYNPATNIANTILDALNHGLINQSRFKELHLELESFTYELVLIYNKRNSSSLHQSQFLRVLDSLNYIFIHGYQSMEEIDFNQYGIKHFFYKGIEVLKKDILLINQMYDRLLSHQLPIQNDRYLSIIHSQVPNYLQALTTHHEWFYYSIVEDDLDYPLIDGLPLYHHMYHSQGSDLMLRYLKNFSIENEICYIYKDDIPELINQFELFKGISSEIIYFNLFEIVIRQLIGNELINQSCDILLSEIESIRLQHLLSSSDIYSLLQSALEHVCEHLSKDQIDYIRINETIILDHLLQDISSNVYPFIYKIIQPIKKKIILEYKNSNTEHTHLINTVSSLDTIAQKIEYMQTSDIGLLDFIDILEGIVLTIEEYVSLFSSFSSTSIAVMIKYLDLEIDSFHTKLTVDTIIKAIVPEQDWHKALILFLKKTSNIKEIESELDIIELEYRI